MQELTAIVGGSVGSDPYAPTTWSGIAAHLFPAMARHDLLHGRALGFDIPKPLKLLLMAKNVHPNRGVWRKHFYFDPAYRRALTRAAARVPVISPFTFQLGHMYSLAEAHPSARAVSFHDGNLAELLQAGFGTDGLSPKRIEQALAWEKRVAGEVTAIFTMSEYLRQSFVQHYGVPAERVWNVGGAFNLTSIPDAQPAKDYSTPEILFIGIEWERKGGPTLLRAFQEVRAALPTAILHIVGPTGLTGLPEGVIAHGRLSKNDPAQAAAFDVLFRRSVLFCLPSLYEPFGIAPLEAMLYQLPCVVTRAWAFQETVQEGVTGDLSTRGDAAELAGKLLHLLRDPERLRQMGEAGRHRALSQFTYDAVVGRMRSAMDRIAAGEVNQA